jgi:hypothetical protein
MGKPFKLDIHTYPSGAVIYHGDGYLTPKSKERVELKTDPIFPSFEIAEVERTGTLRYDLVRELRRYRDKDFSGGHRPVTFTQRRKVMALLGERFKKDFG